MQTLPSPWTGQEAFVFYVAENGLREKYLPGADYEFRGEKKVIVRNVVHDPGNKVIRKARESWVSFETDSSALIRRWTAGRPAADGKRTVD